MPPCQPAVLAEEIEALTEAHAAALVTACDADADLAGQLAGLGSGRADGEELFWSLLHASCRLVGMVSPSGGPQGGAMIRSYAST